MSSQSVPPPIINEGAAKPRARESVNALMPLSPVFCRCGGTGIGTLAFADVGVTTTVVGVVLCGVLTGVFVAEIAVVMGSMAGGIGLTCGGGAT